MNTLRVNKIGMDAEFFLQDTKGHLISVEGLLGGTKENPRSSPSGAGALQEDNVAAEIGIIAASSVREWSERIHSTLGDLEELMRNRGITVHAHSMVQFESTILQTPQAAAFGCSRDLNAWTAKLNPKVSAKRAANNRSAGGHVHISLATANGTPVELDSRAEFIKFLDFTLGVPSILRDRDRARRQLYGQAGSYRLTAYPGGSSGVEYRVLSNFWCFTEEDRTWVWDGVFRATNLFNANDGAFKNLGVSPMKIRRAINSYDTELAKELLGV